MDSGQENESVLRRWRDRRPWFDHLVTSIGQYIDRNGDHYAAAITYYSLLSIVPLVMITVSVLAFVLAGDEQATAELNAVVARALPGSLSGSVGEILGKIIDQRGQFGTFGLVAAAYSGWSWISSVRDALTAMWGQDREDRPVLRTVLTDVANLLGLGAALVLSFLLTAAGGGLGDLALSLAGLDDTAFARTAITVLSWPLVLLTNWLVLLWIIARLPRRPVPLRYAARGAAYAALAFELLKQAGNLYLRLISLSPTVVAFGALIGLLIFVNLVARMLMLVTVWTALRTRMASPDPVAPPPPAVIRPVVADTPSRAKLALVAAAGLLVGRAVGRRGRRHAAEETRSPVT